MTERADVVAVDGLHATVSSGPTETCGSCASPLCSPRVRTWEVSIDAELADDVVPGVSVEIASPPAAMARGVLIFVVPLVLFAAAYLGLSGLASETARAAAGFVGLATGLILAVAVARVWKEPEPTVVRVCESVTSRDNRRPSGTTPRPEA